MHGPMNIKFGRILTTLQQQPVNLLNTELNPICHLLALLEAHHILHVSRIRVNEAQQTLYTKFGISSCKSLWYIK
jgi:hypothetical protein